MPVAPLFAQAILNIANGTSVSSLFSAATLEPIYEALYPAGPPPGGRPRGTQLILVRLLRISRS